MTAQSLLELIRKPAEKTMQDFYSEKGTRQRTEPYPEALRAAINEMLYPQARIERVELPPEPRAAPVVYRPPVAPVVKKKVNLGKNIWRIKKEKSG